MVRLRSPLAGALALVRLALAWAIVPVTLALAGMMGLVSAAGSQGALAFEAVDVSPRVVAFLSSDRGIGNSAAIIGDSFVTVVDAPMPAGARDIIEQIRARTDLPVRYVVNTHWHDDHVWGNQEYGDAFPGVAVIAHDSARTDLLERAVPALAGNLERLRAVVAQRDAILEAGQEEGEPLTVERRAALSARQELFRQTIADFESIRPTPPAVTVSAALTLHDPAIEVRVLHLGRGNTRGDLVVYVPGEGVVITGDLVVHPIPAGGEIPPSEWIASLDRLIGLDAAAVVPGHGPVMHDFHYAERVAGLLAAVVGEVGAAVESGASLEDTLTSVRVAESRAAFTGGDATLELGFDRFFLPLTVEAAYRELTGER